MSAPGSSGEVQARVSGLRRAWRAVASCRIRGARQRPGWRRSLQLPVVGICRSRAITQLLQLGEEAVNARDLCCGRRIELGVNRDGSANLVLSAEGCDRLG